MKSYPYKKINAFTSELSKGNPAAYLTLDREGLKPQDMLAVGREHRGFVSEVVFASPSDSADVKLTYYSSECEVDFCGHGTIATMYDLIKNSGALRQKPVVTLETNRKGVLLVYNEIEREDAVYITAPKAVRSEAAFTRRDAAATLGLSESDMDAALPIALINAGLNTLLVPIASLQTEIDMLPDEKGLKAFCESRGIDIVLAFSMEVSQKGYLAHSRVFAPRFGYLEDPATGSGNSALANYLLDRALWDGSPAKIEQGGRGIRYNPVAIKALDGSVLFGGRASTVIEGRYYLTPAEAD